MLTRALLRAWARSGIASGWLYQCVDRYRGTLASGPIVRTLPNGLRMKLDLRDEVQRQIYFFGAYEPNELSLCLRLLRPGSTVVDAGANVGFYSLMVGAQVGRTGRVLAFEPIPETYAQLRQNLALNQLPQVSAINQALWSKQERLTFSLSIAHEHNVGGYTVAEVGPSARRVESICCCRVGDIYKV